MNTTNKPISTTLQAMLYYHLEYYLKLGSSPNLSVRMLGPLSHIVNNLVKC